jgi:hypothetical protein
MGGVELTEHHVHEAPELCSGTRALDPGAEPLGHRVPVDPVEVRVVKAVTHLAPALLERRDLRALEIVDDLDRSRNGALVAGRPGNDTQLPLPARVQLPPVLRKGDRIAVDFELVEVDVAVGAEGHPMERAFSRDHPRLPVGVQEDRPDREIRRDDGAAPTDAVEVDLDALGYRDRCTRLTGRLVLFVRLVVVLRLVEELAERILVEGRRRGDEVDPDHLPGFRALCRAIDDIVALRTPGDRAEERAREEARLARLPTVDRDDLHVAELVGLRAVCDPPRVGRPRGGPGDIRRKQTILATLPFDHAELALVVEPATVKQVTAVR